VIQLLLRFYFECFALPIKAQPLSMLLKSLQDFNKPLSLAAHTSLWFYEVKPQAYPFKILLVRRRQLVFVCAARDNGCA